MFWRKKDNKEELSLPTITSSDLPKEKNSTSQSSNIYVDVGKIESICYKKCIGDLTTPLLNDAEKNCLSRCSNKFREALDFGENSLLYINYKIREANLMRPDIPTQPTINGM